MPQPAGFSMGLPPTRRLATDYHHFAAAVPATTAERRMDLFRLVGAREAASPRPGWAAIFTKAWAMVCRNVPALRRTCLAYPWPRLYQHPMSTALIAVERPHGDETALFFLPVARPDGLALADLDRRIRWFKDRPIQGCGAMRRQMRVSAWPLPIRRLAWWAALNFGGRHRARLFGTFGVSACSGSGAETVQARTLQTTTLHHGVVNAGGQVAVRVTFDPRVVDGPVVARALDDMERILNNDVVAELRYLEGLRAA